MYSPRSAMVAVYSSDLRKKIVRCYHQGETMRSVTEIFNVSVGFVHYVVDPHRKYGQLVTDPYALATILWALARMKFSTESSRRTAEDERPRALPARA